MIGDGPSPVAMAVKVTKDRPGEGADILGRKIVPMSPRDDLDMMARRIGGTKQLFRRIDMTIGIEIAARSEEEESGARIVEEATLLHEDGQGDVTAPTHQFQPGLADHEAPLAIPSEEQRAGRSNGCNLVGIEPAKRLESIGTVFDGKMPRAQSENGCRVAQALAQS